MDERRRCFPLAPRRKVSLFWGEKKKRGADVYFNSEVLEYLGDKISNSPRLSLENGYDVRSWPLILSPIEFTRFTQYIYKMQTTPNKVIINKL